MSNYVKPQIPLQHTESGDYFYPLTTVDQVIMENGSRLSSITNTTENDNDKFLRVVNGIPTWTIIPYAEEANF